MKDTASTLFVGVMTVNDECAQGTKNDEPGTIVQTALQNYKKLQSAIKIYKILPNDKKTIAGALRQWVDEYNLGLILTTGGIGLRKKDVTPDATDEVIEKDAVGYTIAVVTAAIKASDDAMLIRPKCGVRKQSIIINLPDSKEALQACLKVVLPSISLARRFLIPVKTLPSATLPEFEPAEDGKILISQLKAGIEEYRDSLFANAPPALDQTTPSAIARPAAPSAPAHHVAFSVTEPASANLAEEVAPGHHGITLDHTHHGITPTHHGITPTHHGIHHGVSPSQQTVEITERELMDLDDDDDDLDALFLPLSTQEEAPVATEVDVEDITEGIRELPRVSVDQAFKAVLEKTTPLGSEIVSSTDLFGRILCEDVRAGSAISRLVASVNGYAFAGSILEGESRLIDNRAPTLGPGCAAEVECGRPLPGATNTVIALDFVRVEEGKMISLKNVPSGQGVGSGKSPSAVIAKSGVRLVAADVGKLASSSIKECKTYRAPSVALFTVGDERTDTPDHITVRLLLKELAIEPVDAGICPDKNEDLSVRLNNAVNKADVVIACGGSENSRRYLRALVEKRLQGTTHFGDVSMQPWELGFFATAETENGPKLFFLLPSYPVVDVLLILFVVPAIRKMEGMSNPRYKIVKAKLGKSSALGAVPDYRRCEVAWRPQDGALWIKSLASLSETATLGSTNAVALLPARTNRVSQLKKGDAVDVLLISQI